MASLFLKNVSLATPTVAAEDLTLEVRDHELLVLTGPAGCGASAVLEGIAGLEPFSAGEVLVGERPVGGLPPEEREVALIFGTGGLFPHLNVRENLEFGLKTRRVAKAEAAKRVREVVAMLEIEHLLDQSPGALPEADRFRVALGRAMVRQPKVFLLDAPLARFDAAICAELRGEIIRLQERLRATMIYATADPVEAMTLGGRIAVMREGGIEQVGTSLELYTRPANRCVAEFLGDPPMNFIRGKVRVNPGGIGFQEVGDGTIDLKLENRPEFAPYHGKEVLLGVRPEDLVYLPGLGKPQGNRFQALVDWIEPKGAETVFHLETGAHRLISRSRGGVDRQEAGRRSQFDIIIENVLFFDPETARRIVEQ